MVERGWYCVFPAVMAIEVAVVPGVVSHREERNLGKLALLHRVDNHGVCAVQLPFEPIGGDDMCLIAEVGVGVHHEQLGGVLVIAGIVPPPTHLTPNPLAYKGKIAVIWHRPYVLPCDIDIYLRWGGA